ncbi:hypothetical protein CsatA_014124 [Cannabis sativa]
MACDSHISKVQTMFSPTAPHFSKIILGQTPGNTKLQIPKTFWVKCCESLSSQVFLKLPCGSTWEVGLTKSSDGKVWIDKGWKAFAEHCSLSRGNLLVFRYEGNSQFVVIIFDKTMVEIDYPFDPNHIVDTKDNISVEVWDKSPLPCNHPHKKMKTSAYGKSEEGIDHLRTYESILVFVVKFDLSNKKVCGEFIRNQKLSRKEKAEAFKRAEDFKSEDPFFIVPMHPSYVGSKSSYNMVINKLLNHNFIFSNMFLILILLLYSSYAKVIPSFFAKEYLFRISSSSQDVILKVQDGRTWSVKYYVRPDRVTSKTRIKRGWKAFVQDNDLKVGDVCAFVLRKSIGIVLFEVVIFHENGVANSPMFPIPAAYMRSSTTPSKPKITPCVKIEPSFTNNNNDKESMVSHDLIAKKEIVEPSDKFMKVQSEANTDDNQGTNNKRPSSSGLSRASEAASKFISNNPYFQVNLRSSHVYGGRLYIPMAFGNLYFEKKAQTVTLWVGEKNWHVNLTVNKRSVGLEYRFSSGWTAFARGNYLQPSDVCIFELIQRNQPQMKVTIFRQNGLPL